jgi:DMSO/TMAO reductase YedYZ molybdopterin-dependent catalytic subunit
MDERIVYRNVLRGGAARGQTRRALLRLLPLAPAAMLGAEKRGMIVRSARPEDMEMEPDGFLTWLTPVERFYVRSHVYTPRVELNEWRLTVAGEVNAPLKWTMAELKQLPKVEVVSVMECAGNGRSFHEPRVIGLQWSLGAVGNGRWAGVRLADVLKKAGVKPGAKHVIFNGADVPIGKMPDFIRGVPLDKAMHPDTLLAYDMNGAPLDPSHGYPLRVVAPGWAGDSWVKWVTDIQVLDREFEGFWMKTGYRRPVRPVAPGASVPPEEMEPVTTLRVKSVIATPVEGETVAGGTVRIQGAAWSGGSPITRVEVSTDSGRTWRAARLGTDSARYGWRLFETAWTPKQPGSYVLMSRATDASGETQPVVADWNPSGYSYNACPQVRVEVGSEARKPERKEAPVPAFPAKVKQACLGCHGEDIIAGQRLTRAQWERDVQKMAGWGAPVRDEDREEIIDFLVRHFGAQ